MKCPYCGYLEQRVLDSRPARDGEAIRRRRECLKCGRRFTTFEAWEVHPLFVIKRDGSREEFDKEKLLRSVLIACRKRPVPIETLRTATDRLEKHFSETFEAEIPSVEIGKEVLQALLSIDIVAYIRFASVYMDFQSPYEFLEIIHHIQPSN